MAFEPTELRRVLGHFATGVSVVTSTDPRSGEPCGLTANAVASVSLRPPLVLVCIENEADSHVCIKASGIFAINVLRSGQERQARRFSGCDVLEKFRGVAYRSEATGAPVLDGVLAWVDCRVWATYPGGDHTIYVGEVIAGDAIEGTPLLFYRGGYGGLTR